MDESDAEPLERVRATPLLAFDPGHFYSPIVDPASLAAQREALWPASPAVRGIDFNDTSHRRVLTEWFPRFIGDYDYPERRDGSAAPIEFHTQNSQFSWLDARALFVLLRAWHPQRVVEVGSGYSSLLIADVNRRFLGNSIDFTCIDPYPPAFLRGGVEGITRVIERGVQHVAPEVFRALQPGDILFVDSSHVAKTGSDVNHLLFDVVPVLAAGVHVHVHDVFLPFEYPPDWVLVQNRSWNEQYVVRALLMYAEATFRVDFGCAYAFHRFRELVIQALAHPRGHGFAGGSLWFTKVA